MKNIRTRFVLIITICALLFSFHLNAAQSDFFSRDPAKIQLGSVHASVLDIESGQMLYEKNADAVVPVASITKVMTAMVVLDAKLPMNERVTIVPIDKTKINKNAYTRIRVDSKLRRKDLIRIALMSSENVAAYNLAVSYPGGLSAFVEAMNKKAKSLKMHNTRFADPSGLMQENVSTASDLVKLLVAADTYPLIKEYSTTSVHTAYFRGPKYRLGYGNTNPLVRSSKWDVQLSKTGYLKEAGRCLVMVTKVDGRELAMVFLDSLGKRTPLGDAGRVKRWLTTGRGGKVAGVARDYERERAAKYTQASLGTVPR